MKLFKFIVAASLLLGLGSTSAFAHTANGYTSKGKWNKTVVVKTTKSPKRHYRRAPIVVKKVYRPAPKVRKIYVKTRFRGPRLALRPIPRVVKYRPHVRVKKVVKVRRHYR
ncbi:MAG: hypothetical protein KC609_19855 [Myxococcales bacterium]|nr:hypothetical protein [Myxococcales bacterium]